MSFGTGHHATTYMMLDWMREFGFSGKTVLDMGTGTGVLAIMAEKLGASRIIAIDIDDWSIENAKENIEANGCHRIQLLQSDKLNTSELYDIILANINLNVILELLPAFRNHLSHSGLLILSGLLTDDESRVKAAGIETGIDFIAQKEKNNWLSMTFKK
jgi:ribosomal protein L11 methyltransferase